MAQGYLQVDVVSDVNNFPVQDAEITISSVDTPETVIRAGGDHGGRNFSGYDGDPKCAPSSACGIRRGGKRADHDPGAYALRRISA